MAKIRTANPALKINTFERYVLAENETLSMTLQGTVKKTLFLLGILMISFGVVWTMYTPSLDPDSHLNIYSPITYALGCAAGGFLFGMRTFEHPKTAHLTAPIYVAFQGAFIACTGVIIEVWWPGIILVTVGLTLTTFFALLAVYATKLIKPTENTKLGVAAATGGLLIIYIIQALLSMSGLTESGSFILNATPFGIGMSLFGCGVAAFNLVLDFDFIEQGVEQGTNPKHMEWIGAFGLIVTLVWLYFELLHLLALLAAEDDD